MLPTVSRGDGERELNDPAVMEEWAAIVLTWRLTALWGALSARCFLGSKEPRQYSKSHISMLNRITNVLTSSRVKNKDALRKLKGGRDIVLCFSSQTVRYSNQTGSWNYNQCWSGKPSVQNSCKAMFMFRMGGSTLGNISRKKYVFFRVLPEWEGGEGPAWIFLTFFTMY